MKKLQQHLVPIVLPDTPLPKNAVLLQRHREEGEGERGSLNFVDPTVKSTILTAGPGKQKEKQRKESLNYEV